MPARLREATDPEEYARALLEILARIGSLTGEAETRMIELLDDARAEIIDQLAALDLESPSRALLNRARAGIDQTTANLAARMGKTVKDLQAEGHAAGLDLALKPLGPGVEVVSAGITLTQLEIMQAYSAELIQDISSQVRKRINSELTSIVIGAKSPTAAAEAIGKTLTSTNHFSTVAHRARAIVVTEVGRAHALGTQEAQAALQRSLHEAGDPTEVRKRWLNAHLPGARATHLAAEARYAPNGSEGPIPANDLYTIAGVFKALYPRDPSLPPRESVHCHCVSITVLDEGSEAAAGDPEATAPAKAAYTAAKAKAAAPGAVKTDRHLSRPAAGFLTDPYGSAGLSPTATLKTGGSGYAGKILAKKLGYATTSRLTFDRTLGAWKHPAAPTGKQVPTFDKLAPTEQVALMTSAGLNATAKKQIVASLEALEKPEPYTTTPPTAAPPPADKPTTA